MLRIARKGLMVFLSLSLCGLVGCGSDLIDEIEDAVGGSESTSCAGVWVITSAVLDGTSQPTVGAIWTISPSAWDLQTAICSGSGTTNLDGGNISMTVSQQNCANPIPAPEGRTASGTCSVDNNTLNMTLSHDLEGTTHTLTVTGTRQ